MRDRILSILLPIVAVIGLIILWQWLLDLRVLNRALFPYPMEVVEAIKNSEELHSHIFASVKALFISVSIGYCAGFLVGIFVSFQKQFSFLEDIISFFMAIPGISWAPLFIITIGFGIKTIIAVGVLTAFFPVVYNVYHGLKEVDINYNYLGDIFEYSQIEKVFLIYLPAIMNYILIALKLSFARTWRTVVAVEMVAASLYGLGYMIFDARELLNVDTMFAGIILSGLIYILIELVIVKSLELVTVRRWGMKI